MSGMGKIFVRNIKNKNNRINGKGIHTLLKK